MHYTQRDELKFLPVLNSGRMFAYMKHKTDWWTGNNDFYYEYALINLYDLIESNAKDIRTASNHSGFLLFDSGGFQVVTQNINLSPSHGRYLMMKSEQHHPDVQVTLDMPPYMVDGDTKQFGKKVSKDMFVKRMNQTAEFGEQMWDSRKDDKIKLYGVIQGETLQEIELWFKTLTSKVGAYDGYALSPKPSNDPMKVALYVLFSILNLKDKPLHILQVAGKNCIPILAHLKRFNHNLITSDALSYCVGSQFKTWFNHMLDGGLSFKEGAVQPSKLPCYCCACRKLNELKLDPSSIEFSSHLDLHNLQMILSVFDYHTHAKDCPEYKLSKPAQQAIGFIQYGLENGIEKAYNKYFVHTKGLGQWIG